MCIYNENSLSRIDAYFATQQQQQQQNDGKLLLKST